MRSSSPLRSSDRSANATNLDVAARLDEAAALLKEQRANPYRVQAYRRAAETVRALDRPVAYLIEAEGIAGLDALPGIGASLARAIVQIVATGRMPMLTRLRGEADPVELLASVPGISRRSAERMHDELSIHTLEELEAAAHDGRLTDRLGIRGKRLDGIRETLAGRLSRVRRSESATEPPPAVAEILDIDRQYRRQAAAGELPMIAPRRFNPERLAWLPVLHTDRAGRHYTAMFSNTARAHALHRTNDWVVIYADGGHGEHQYTVITALHGELAGRRIVRGREAECATQPAVS
jgi:hypothetical protein